jgi:hypothetical protein
MRVSILAAAERLKSSKELVITNSYPSEFYTVTAAKATSSVFWTSKILGTQGAADQHTVNVFLPDKLVLELCLQLYEITAVTLSIG